MALEKVAVQVLPEVVMNDTLAQAIQNAVSAEEVRSLLVAASEKQQADGAQLAADQAAAEQARLDAAAKAAQDEVNARAAQPVKRTVNIGGRMFEFEGADEAEVDRLELNAFKVAYVVHADQPVAAVSSAPDAAAEAAAAEAEVAAKVELERKFRLGEISAADYIQQSGAMRSYLESEGISIASLKNTTQETEAARYAASWTEAGKAFKDSYPDWPGGDRNQELIGLKIIALGLTDAEDKVAALAQAYADMKRTNSVFPGDAPPPGPLTQADVDAAVARALAGKTPVVAAAVAAGTPTPEATRAAAAAKIQSMSSSMFGQSSGVSGAPVLSPSVIAAKAVIPNDASPAEIIAAWKESQILSGQDPNAAFIASHRANAR